jgi:mRNA interferase MazF
VVIHQGDIYYIDLVEPSGSGPGYRQPHVVIQNNIFNQSRLNTVMVCALSSNLRRAEIPGNLQIDVGEAGLPRQSVVLVTQVFTVHKSQLVEYIGTVSAHRIRQILDGLRLVTIPREI